MSSERQIAANKLNSQKSTGPRTSEGKAKVSVNALKHGLTARDIVLPGENPVDFESFRADLMASLDPQGGLEATLAQMIVADAWRLRRVPILEATLYRRGCAELQVAEAEASVEQYESTQNERVMASLDAKTVAASDRKAHADAEKRLEQAQAELDDPSFNVTRVLETCSLPLSNLWRHEVAIERSMMRKLHELERLQAKRAGEHVPAPAAVDVDLVVSEPLPGNIATTGASGETAGN